MVSIVGFVKRLEDFFFRYRLITLSALLVLTAVMGMLASQLHMSAGFDKQLPVGHEYTDTFFKYRTQLFGSNRVMVVVRARDGDIWTPESLKKLHEVTEAVLYLPGVDRRSVQSLWTPNTRVYELTEEGFQAEDVIGGTVTPDALDAGKIAQIRDRAARGGYTGSLVASDGSAAMIVADLLEEDPGTHEQLDYLALAGKLEQDIRAKYETPTHEIEIVGFAKQIGDIADGAKGVAVFFALATLLTALAVYWYCRSLMLTALPIFCSMVSVVWQFGTLTLLGYGLDPLAILVPFLVFAIGVSHGVQQINAISKAVAGGADSLEAARESFSSLFIPGTLALVTAFVGFITLVLIPIPMIRELGITASIGVGYKIVTNLIMLPLTASFFRFSRDYALHLEAIQARRGEWIQRLGFIADINHARLVLAVAAVLLGIAVWQSHGRHIGALQPGAPELRPDARYNQDIENIVKRFDLGMDVLTVVFETPNDSCNNYPVLNYIEQFTLHMSQVPGVLSVQSLSALAKFANAGLNEGNPKMIALPRDSKALQVAVGYLPEAGGLFNRACTMMAANVYLADHKATTIEPAIHAVKSFRAQFDGKPLGIEVRLASGNVGVLAATNEEVEMRELPMMLYVYAAIVVLVLLAYRDWRAMLACCVPLTLATFLGYWFMKELDIGLTVATLPVMVLATGIGVDYAFYIYNRLLIHLARGESMKESLEGALREVGVATIFTAITLSVGVATWAFSDLKFQADMGILLTFMFMVNMLMAITVLPAFAVKLDSLFPRRGPVKAPAIGH
ncbi:efflux RND transporter permease subunit [uncultured Dechloromonas sp.]|uniref:efflux RND transporter permease subunit n=1 Tax=uncultured Dechloromonas sp. TaxID=171719 RepID=UPI0025EA5088|nr:efflux RND transporter permease subunit [uncultured Dechloromonas sp.]